MKPREEGPWNAPPAHFATSLKLYLCCSSLDLHSSSEQLTEHLKKCADCRKALVDLIEGLQYLRLLIMK